MVVWRRCSGSCAGQTRDRGRLEFCCRPPRLYGTAWLAHRPCRRTLGCLQDCSRHTGSAYSGTQLPTSNQTAAHQLLVLQIKHKAQTLGSECVTHILSAPGLLHPLQGSIAALQHWSSAALHSIDTRGEVFRIRKTSIICPGTCFPLIFTQVAQNISLFFMISQFDFYGSLPLFVKIYIAICQTLLASSDLVHWSDHKLSAA